MTYCKHLTTRCNPSLRQEERTTSTLYKFINIIHYPTRSNICCQKIVRNVGNHLVTMPNLVPLSPQILWIECHAFPRNGVGYILQSPVSRCLTTGSPYLCNHVTNFIEIPNISVTCGLPLQWFLNLLGYQCMGLTVLIVVGD